MSRARVVARGRRHGERGGGRSWKVQWREDNDLEVGRRRSAPRRAQGDGLACAGDLRGVVDPGQVVEVRPGSRPRRTRDRDRVGDGAGVGDGVLQPQLGGARARGVGQLDVAEERIGDRRQRSGAGVLVIEGVADHGPLVTDARGEVGRGDVDRDRRRRAVGHSVVGDVGERVGAVRNVRRVAQVGRGPAQRPVRGAARPPGR